MNQVLDIVRLLRPYWGYMAQSLLVGVMVMFFSIPGPYITKLLIDNIRAIVALRPSHSKGPLASYPGPFVLPKRKAPVLPGLAPQGK